MARASLVSRNVAPIFTHDCTECKFLGILEEVDLYVCPRDLALVRRFGDEGPEYGAMPMSMAHNLKGDTYAFAAALVARRVKRGSAYVPNAYVRAEESPDSDREPNSGDAEIEMERRLMMREAGF